MNTVQRKAVGLAAVLSVCACLVIRASLADDGRPSAKSSPAVASRQTGITGVSRGKVDLSVPPNASPGQVWRYGLGFPVQLAPRTAGIFCNIRIEGTPYGDFEIGTDLILFDELGKIDQNSAIPISRSADEIHPETKKPCIMAKYPVIGGFVPFGAKRVDGSPHPHAGTGFGISQVCPYPKDFSEPLPPAKQLVYYREFHQFTYDGKEFSASSPKRLLHWPLPDGWDLNAPGLTPAIADGDDLLFALTCTKDTSNCVSGVGRFKCLGKRWQPVSFVPITDPKSPWTEPSLVRDTDGCLLFSARGGRRGSRGDMPLWRSADGGASWKQQFYHVGTTAGGPIAINRAADGAPFIATNKPPRDRRILLLWPINDQRTGLEKPIIARDSHAEFGPPPGSDRWKVDHPVGAVLRLADGRWHSVLVYRVLDQGENYGKPPTPQTGCYVEEVFSRGKPLPAWNF